MQSNQMQNMDTGPGPGAPVPRIPTPTTKYTPTSMNTVKRSDIVVAPAKVFNNLDSINNNQTSGQVYLYNGEKNQTKSVTDSNNSFNVENNPIDDLNGWVKKKSREELEEYALKWEAAVEYGNMVMKERNRDSKYYNEEIERLKERVKRLEEIVDLNSKYSDCKCKHRKEYKGCLLHCEECETHLEVSPITGEVEEDEDYAKCYGTIGAVTNYCTICEKCERVRTSRERCEKRESKIEERKEENRKKIQVSIPVPVPRSKPQQVSMPVPLAILPKITPGVAVLGCEYGCKICAMQRDIHGYCCNECKDCEAGRREKGKIRQREIVAQVRKESEIANPKIDPLLIAIDERSIPDHRYLFVTLTASPDWGSNEYLKIQLLKNWMKMLPKSTNPVASAYVWEYTVRGTIHLHGLIRYAGKGIRISKSMTIYSNWIQIENTTGKSQRQEGKKTIEEISEYNKTKWVYNTPICKIREKWKYITKEGEVIGDNLEAFL